MKFSKIENFGKRFARAGKKQVKSYKYTLQKNGKQRRERGGGWLRTGGGGGGRFHFL